jgi:membrane protein insertase Oxa1/YidC/SpoIIIJ
LDIANVQHTFLGIDLLQSGNWVLTILCAVVLFLQTTTMSRVQPKPAPQKMPNGQEMPDMSKMMPMMNLMMVFMMGSFVYSVKS